MRVKYFLFVVVLFMLSTEQVRAGISSGWIDYFVGKIGKPGSSAFEVMSENGLILF